MPTGRAFFKNKGNDLPYLIERGKPGKQNLLNEAVAKKLVQARTTHLDKGEENHKSRWHGASCRDEESGSASLFFAMKKIAPEFL